MWGGWLAGLPAVVDNVVVVVVVVVVLVVVLVVVVVVAVGPPCGRSGGAAPAPGLGGRAGTSIFVDFRWFSSILI